MSDHELIDYYQVVYSECPHGRKPARGSALWKSWMANGHRITDHGVVCLSVPLGKGCKTCSDEVGEMVPWIECPQRIVRKSLEAGSIVGRHQKIPALKGPQECLERDCDDYYDSEGHEVPGLEQCSHTTTVTACSCQLISDTELSDIPCEETG
ncbi:hypothetical protein [Rhodococcus qingshengii]|uniref:hypothetical protein n=1 Tax=Rhodococcus qingshengii TaxID=334542 RepID=UPI0035E08EDF